MFKKSPLDVLIDAKLAGRKDPSIMFEYTFRSNEQAAEVALNALEDAGYEIVPKIEHG